MICLESLNRFRKTQDYNFEVSRKEFAQHEKLQNIRCIGINSSSLITILSDCMFCDIERGDGQVDANEKVVCALKVNNFMQQSSTRMKR